MQIRPLQAGEVPQDLLRDGYNQAAAKYNVFALRLSSPRLEWLARLYANLGAPATSHVLELGCGTGDPCTLDLARHVGRLVATDISTGQLGFCQRALERDGHVVESSFSTAASASEAAASAKAAAEAVRESHVGEPAVQLLEADMVQLSFDEASFDAVCAFYSLQSLPIEQQRQLLLRIFRWLKPGGLLLFNCTSVPDEGVVMEGWLGMNAYSAGLGQERALTMVNDIGFHLVETWTGQMEVDVPFTWILARKT